MIQASLATKYVFTAAMIAFINHYAPPLHLPLDIPIKQKEIQSLHPPAAFVTQGKETYADLIRINNYSFSFGSDSLDLMKLEEDGMQSFGILMERLGESSNSLMERASRMKYTVSTNDLYAIGTNYLAALEIDVPALEKNHPALQPKRQNGGDRHPDADVDGNAAAPIARRSIGRGQRDCGWRRRTDAFQRDRGG